MEEPGHCPISHPNVMGATLYIQRSLSVPFEHKSDCPIQQVHAIGHVNAILQNMLLNKVRWTKCGR